MVKASTMAARGFSGPGAPGSAQETTWKRKHLVRAQAVPGVKTLWVHRTSVETFNALMVVLQEHGARLDQRVDDWSYANRDIRGVPGEDSYHRYAKGADLDAIENPQHALTTTFPIFRTHQACDLLELVWGFDWSSRFRDPMHFQDELSRKRRRWIAFQIAHPSPRRKKLAKLAGIRPRELTRRIRKFERFGA